MWEKKQLNITQENVSINIQHCFKRLTYVGASNVATSVKVDSDELAKSWGVVILDCFGIAKCFQDGVGLEQLLFQFSLRWNRIKDRKWWISKAEKTRHCISLVPNTRKLRTEQSNLAGTMYMCIHLQFKPQTYIWVLFWVTEKPNSLTSRLSRVQVNLMSLNLFPRPPINLKVFLFGLQKLKI